MSLSTALARINRWAIWRVFHLRVWGFTLQACSFDRLLNLLLHKFGLMNRDAPAHFRKLVKPGMTVVDVGANQGLFAMLFASLVGPSGKVFSFEPEPNLYKIASSNLRANGIANVELLPMALGSGPGELTLQKSALNSGDNRLSRQVGANSEGAVQVRIEPFDRLGLTDKVDVVKIDVQGWETEVLKGMETLLQNNPDVILQLEFWPYGLRAAGSEPLQLLEYLQLKGFTLFDVDSENKAIADLSAFSNGFAGKRYGDILALRSPSRVQSLA